MTVLSAHRQADRLQLLRKRRRVLNLSALPLRRRKVCLTVKCELKIVLSLFKLNPGSFETPAKKEILGNIYLDGLSLAAAAVKNTEFNGQD